MVTESSWMALVSAGRLVKGRRLKKKPVSGRMNCVTCRKLYSCSQSWTQGTARTGFFFFVTSSRVYSLFSEKVRFRKHRQHNWRHTKLALLILLYLTAAGSTIRDRWTKQKQYPAIPRSIHSSSRFFFTSQEILRHLYQRCSRMFFSYSKQFTFYVLSLSFTFTGAEYADVVNI